MCHWKALHAQSGVPKALPQAPPKEQKKKSAAGPVKPVSLLSLLPAPALQRGPGEGADQQGAQHAKRAITC